LEVLVARLKLVYLGGGSTRAPGTLAALAAQAENFRGSEVVLVDLYPERLETVTRLAQRLAEHRGAELKLRWTTDRAAALEDADAVLSSFRPGGFEARALDERIPLKHGVIGQETQGPGGLFMALRSVTILKGVVAEMTRLCPRAVLFNYTNPVNLVAQAVSRYSPVQVLSLCEGPLVFPQELARTAGLDPSRLEVTMVGLNHACWSVRHRYRGETGEEALLPLLAAAYTRLRNAGAPARALRLLHLAVVMNAVPASYFVYYYFKDEILAELRAQPTTRAEDILAAVPDYWAHYRAQLEAPVPTLDPTRSRGGIFELELAFDVMDAMFNDRGEVWPVNVPNRGALPDFPEELVVELPARVSKTGAEPRPQPPLPKAVVGLVQQLGAYQALAAEAAWEADRRKAVQALAGHPLVLSLPKAEALYAELAQAQRAWLPEGLW
jgi:6-phospho-beta-glucosidase